MKIRCGIMKIENALVMEIMETQNGFEITKEMVKNSLESFINAPIVYNKKQQTTNYRDEEFQNYYDKNVVIGFVSEVINIIENKVLANIYIRDEYVDLWTGKYDNWCIQFNENKTAFIVLSIEIF